MRYIILLALILISLTAFQSPPHCYETGDLVVCVTISGNTFDGNSYLGLSLQDVAGAVVTGNAFIGTGVKAGPGPNVSGCTHSGNTFSGGATADWGGCQQ